MDHFTCHSCQHAIGPGDNYYIHGSKAYCKDDYMAKYADRCYGCGMPIMDQYIKVYTPKKRVWHKRCYQTHKRHNPASSLADMRVMDEQGAEFAPINIESILNKFEAMVTSCISDSLENLEPGSHEKISEGILTLINALGVLFSSIDIVDDARRKAGKTGKCVHTNSSHCKMINRNSTLRQPRDRPTTGEADGLYDRVYVKRPADKVNIKSSEGNICCKLGLILFYEASHQDFRGRYG